MHMYSYFDHFVIIDKIIAMCFASYYVHGACREGSSCAYLATCSALGTTSMVPVGRVLAVYN